MRCAAASLILFHCVEEKNDAYYSLRLSTFHVFLCTSFIIYFIIYYIIYFILILFIYLFFMRWRRKHTYTFIHASPERQVALMLAVMCQEKRR